MSVSRCQACEMPLQPFELEKEMCTTCSRYLEKRAKATDRTEMPSDEHVKHVAEVEAKEKKLGMSIAEAVKKEEVSREVSRRHLLPFIQRFNPDYQAGWVHAEICKELEQFERDLVAGKSPRLIINVPPRHGKSEIASRTFPAWFLGRHPKWEVIACSYNSSLAMDFSKKVRELVDDKSYHTVFPTKLHPKSQSAERWNTLQGGSYTAAGVQGPITGRGAHLAIIDDPLKDREEAESETNRNKIKAWYSSTFYTRLAPQSGIVLILTRWHEDDLAGWLIDEMKQAEKEMGETGEWPEGADRWKVIKYPMEAMEDEKYRKKGEPLHPQRYGRSAMMRMKRTMLPRDWWALMQQEPSAEDGDFFKKEMIRYYKPSELPHEDEMRNYVAWDLAISKNEYNDYTAAFVVSVDRNDTIYVRERFKARVDTLEIIDAMIDIQDRWDCDLQGIEDGQISLTLEPILIKTMQEKRKHIPYEKLRTRGKDKVTRARPLQGRMSQGKVLFPSGTDWVQDTVNEMMAFPEGKHDDQVDALAWVGHMVLYMRGTHEKVEKVATWRDKLRKVSKGRGKRNAAIA